MSKVHIDKESRSEWRKERFRKAFYAFQIHEKK